jgi:ubiquinone/menaquinone biosynthesis C-methylase UbiE
MIFTMNSKTHWESVYQTKPAEGVSWFQPHAQQSLELIRRITHGETSRIIDVGGGASTLVDDLLARQSFDISVLDISTSALDVARQRLGPKALAVNWIAGDITEVALPANTYDIWHDRAVFHFLTDSRDRAAYVEQVRRSVRRGGHVIVAAFGPDGPMQCSGLPVVRYAPGALHSEFGGKFELLEHLTEAHHTPAGAIQQFVYCHCVMH